MALTNVFVTVGTTQFDKLISIITSKKVLEILKLKGCKKLTIQIGRGVIPDITDDSGIEIKIFRLKDSIDYEIQNADLIIGHAGAGTCLQSLQAGKRLMVVVNRDLMDNHQMELAERLYNEGYIHFAFVTDIEDVLISDELSTILKRYPTGDVNKYVRFIDRVMGFQT